tara:strand:+ start:1109 stop:1453 length:345 start_codon:yes stop_codon:yes gene_type:complete
LRETEKEKFKMAFAYMQKIFNARDNEAFRAAHHEDYMFIREFEMVTLDDHIDTVDEFMRSGYDIHKRWMLIHENDYVGEVRWEEGDEIVTHVTLLKDGLIWRGFVNRVKKLAAV